MIKFPISVHTSIINFINFATLCHLRNYVLQVGQTLAGRLLLQALVPFVFDNADLTLSPYFESLHERTLIPEILLVANHSAVHSGCLI
jgi:hypothetical protein